MEDLEQLGTKFKKIHNIVGNEFNKKMARVDLTRSQMEVLMYLIKSRDKDISGRDIEKFFDLTNPTVSGILDRLENKGFIIRKTCSEDARIKHIKVTDKAIEIKEQSKRMRREIQKKLFEGMSKEDIATISYLLDKILNNMQEGGI